MPSKHLYELYNGYNGQVQVHKLPDRLKCARDGQLKAHAAFATSRLNFVRARGVKSQQAMKQLICVQCTGAPPTELLCHGPCNKTRGLNSFSGVQRNSPDSAVCKQCMHDRLLVEPGEFRDFTPNDYEEGYGDDDDDGMTHDGTASVISGVHNATIDSSGSDIRGGRAEPTGDDDDDEEKYRSPSASVSNFTHPPKSTTSTANASSSIQRFGMGSNSSVIRPSSNGKASTTGGPWAKIGAGPRREIPRPFESDDDVNVESEDDDGEWDM